MTAQELIAKAYDITEKMSVSGGAIEAMAALRAALKAAYAAVTETDKSEEDDGK